MSEEVLSGDGFEGLPLGKKAIIVGVEITAQKAGSNENDEDLDELAALLKTLGIPELQRISQKRQKLDPHSLIGRGKALEIRDMAQEVGADMVVFDRPLSAPQVKNLEQLTCCAVFDRTGIILEIFSRHARSSQAKTQVEIARLEYVLSRLTGAWSHFQRQQGGGVRSRGMGEKQIEVDRRRARMRIDRLRQKLQRIEKECQLRRRQRSGEWKVALVGYTNSGKTTLMKGLSRSAIKGQDELFATLDTQVKVIDPRTRPKVLVSDTVGFIRRLPHRLVESFKSTLAEVAEADLILHVVDVSHENYKAHMVTTDEVLREIGASNVPVMICFNKVDKLNDVILPRILRGVYRNSMVVSSLSHNDIELVRDRISQFFHRFLDDAVLSVPLSDSDTQSRVFAHCLIMNSDYTDPTRVVFTVRATAQVLSQLREFRVSGSGCCIGQS